MRMRITKPPPQDYGICTDFLLVGRIYNLDPAFASALMLDGCAELYDLLSPEERRERTDALSHDGWTPRQRTGAGWLQKS